jgi:biotin carboxyl carrier protein
MITYRKPGLLGASFVLLFLAAAAPHAPLGVDFPGEAQAIVGRPLTPVSVAGVARRTAVRTTAVVATTTTASAASAQSATAQQQAATAQQQSATAQQQSATAQQQAAAAQQPAAAPSDQALPLGTVVAALPAGCSQTTASGVQFYKCGANYYRAVFQGNNLVYVTAKP